MTDEQLTRAQLGQWLGVPITRIADRIDEPYWTARRELEASLAAGQFQFDHIHTKLLAALRSIRDNGPITRAAGLCYAIARSGEFGNATDVIKTLVNDILHYAFIAWPKYSGNHSYPVPGGYAEFARTTDYWDKDTEYGRLRWELLDWVIEWCEARGCFGRPD